MSCNFSWEFPFSTFYDFIIGGICFYLARWIFDLVSLHLHLFVTFSACKVSISPPRLKLGWGPDSTSRAKKVSSLRHSASQKQIRPITGPCCLVFYLNKETWWPISVWNYDALVWCPTFQTRFWNLITEGNVASNSVILVWKLYWRKHSATQIDQMPW